MPRYACSSSWRWHVWVSRPATRLRCSRVDITGRAEAGGRDPWASPPAASTRWDRAPSARPDSALDRSARFPRSSACPTARHLVALNVRDSPELGLTGFGADSSIAHRRCAASGAAAGHGSVSRARSRCLPRKQSRHSPTIAFSPSSRCALRYSDAPASPDGRRAAFTVFVRPFMRDVSVDDDPAGGS